MTFYFTENWEQVTTPDFDNYKSFERSIDLIAEFDVTQEEVGHEEPLTYYLTLPNGEREEVDASTVDAAPEYTTGIDTHYVVDTPLVGEWQYIRGGEKWADCPVEAPEWWSQQETYTFPFDYCLLVPFTADEIAEREQEKQELEQQQAEAEAQAELTAAIPDAIAELSELAADTATSTEDLVDAVAELSQLVSDLLGGE